MCVRPFHEKLAIVDMSLMYVNAMALIDTTNPCNRFCEKKVISSLVYIRLVLFVLAVSE